MTLLLLLSSNFSGTLIVFKTFAILLAFLGLIKCFSLQLLSFSRLFIFLLGYTFLIAHCAFFVPPKSLIVLYLFYPLILFCFSIYGKISLKNLHFVCVFGILLAIVFFTIKFLNLHSSLLIDTFGFRYDNSGLYWKSRHYLAYFYGVLFSYWALSNKRLHVLILMLLYFFVTSYFGSKTLFFIGFLIPIFHLIVYFDVIKRILLFKYSLFIFFLALPIIQMAIYLGLSFDSVALENLTVAELSSYRPYQAQVLLDAFLDSPLIGKGLGYVDLNLKRSDAFPWASELIYLRMLRDLGIMGYLFLCLVVVSVMGSFKCLNNEDKLYVVPALVGAFIVLTVSIANPIFENFDALFVLILPALLRNKLVISGMRK